MDPEFAPPVTGLKVTLTVQLAPTLSAPRQLLVWVKGPLVAMPEIIRVVVPELVTVTVCAELVVLRY